MKEKITMYQITTEILKEEDYLTGAVEVEIPAAIIKPVNSNNCKYLIKVLNSVGIDENLFKVGNSYAFTQESIKAVKTIIEKHVVYAEIMQQKPQERKAAHLQDMIFQVENILRNEIEDASLLHSQLNKLELITLNKMQQMNRHLQNLALPTFDKMLSVADDEFLQMYYIEEMILLRNKFTSLQGIISEMRMEEVVQQSEREVSTSDSEELLHNTSPYLKKIQLDRLVVKDLLNPKKSKEPYIKQTVKELSVEVDMSKEDLREELKKFRKMNYQSHELFELSLHKDYCMKENHVTPYDMLKQAKIEYEERQKEPGRKNLSAEVIAEIEEIFNDIL